MSVGLTKVLDDLGLTPEATIEKFDGYGLLRFSVVLVREMKLGVTASPTTDEPWHGDVHGKKTKAIERQFVAASTDWVRTPDATS